METGVAECSGTLREREGGREGIRTLPVAVEMHAAHGGRVSVQRVDAVTALGVPHAQRPVGGAADHRGDRHLTAPHPAGVTGQRPQTLEGEEGGC